MRNIGYWWNKIFDTLLIKLQTYRNSGCHKPLLDALKECETKELPKGTLIYHGSRAHDQHTNFLEKELTGTRKWFSEDACYVAGYAFFDMTTEEFGSRLLWICRLNKPITGLLGNQCSFQTSSPWSIQDFPRKFPDNFGIYAKEAQRITDSSIALLNFYDKKESSEILIWGHTSVVEVIEVIVLPETKDDALEFVRANIAPYALTI